MALYVIKAMKFPGGTKTTLFLVLTIPAILGSCLAGRMTDRVGAKRTLVFTIVAWIVLLLAVVAVPSQHAFLRVGLLIGLVFGGVPTAERPLLLSLVPAAEAGRFFSLVLLSSRAPAVTGPLIWGITVDVLEPSLGTAIAYRTAVLTVVAMLLHRCSCCAVCLIRLVAPVIPYGAVVIEVAAGVMDHRGPSATPPAACRFAGP